MQTTYIYGRHAVEELIKNAPERIQGVFVSFGAEKDFAPICRAHHIRMEPLADHDFRKELQGAVHQGVVAKVAMDGLMHDYGQFMRDLAVTPDTCLVLLNEITDPHNVGAIIRSAAAFGAAGVLIPAHNQSPITGTVAKASAGMVFTVPIVAINNENQVIEDLKTKKFWVYGLAGEGANKIGKETFDAPAVFVVGSEGEGLRVKTREHCDILLKIPMHPRTESLNASVSAAIVLAEWSKQHHKALE